MNPAESQYTAPNPTAPIPAEGGEPGSADERTGLRSNIGSLPVTGLDLLILGGVTLMLAATVFLLRRLSAPRRPVG